MFSSAALSSGGCHSLRPARESTSWSNLKLTPVVSALLPLPRGSHFLSATRVSRFRWSSRDWWHWLTRRSFLSISSVSHSRCLSSYAAVASLNLHEDNGVGVGRCIFSWFMILIWPRKLCHPQLVPSTQNFDPCMRWLQGYWGTAPQTINRRPSNGDIELRKFVGGALFIRCGRSTVVSGRPRREHSSLGAGIHLFCLSGKMKE